MSESYLGEVVSSSGVEAASCVRSGDVLCRSGDYVGGIGCYHRAIALDSCYVLAHFRMGIAYDHLKEYVKSVSCYDRAIALKPDQAEFHFKRCVSCMHMGEYMELVRSYNRGILLDPDYVSNRKLELSVSCRGLGNRYLRRGDYNESINWFTLALKYNALDGSAYHQMGLAYSKLGAYEKSLACYRSSLELCPSDVLVEFNMGNAYYRLGDYAAAITCYARCLSLNPSHTSARTHLSTCLSHLLPS